MFACAFCHALVQGLRGQHGGVSSHGMEVVNAADLEFEGVRFKSPEAGFGWWTGPRSQDMEAPGAAETYQDPQSSCVRWLGSGTPRQTPDVRPTAFEPFLLKRRPALGVGVPSHGMKVSRLGVLGT
ncbi:unnamed protein product [Durusdinium trenchii]|uniref:Uncharacterized protein n=1 Tax=Durusdinium trenchii TaxID=1381693 RepID=A0ABP0NGT9_9DINO